MKVGKPLLKLGRSKEVEKIVWDFEISKCNDTFQLQ